MTNLTQQVVDKLTTTQQIRLAILMADGLDTFDALTAVVMEATEVTA